jgi:hypothetical protein
MFASAGRFSARRRSASALRAAWRTDATEKKTHDLPVNQSGTRNSSLIQCGTEFSAEEKSVQNRIWCETDIQQSSSAAATCMVQSDYCKQSNQPVGLPAPGVRRASNIVRMDASKHYEPCPRIIWTIEFTRVGKKRLVARQAARNGFP